MLVRDAEFIRACVHPKDFPRTGWPEIAFVGRSNVGKSSLLNALLGRKRLAKISATPGKTQTVNFFAVNKSVFFVDLPGYGYAKVPQAVQRAWRSFIEAYLSERDTLRAVVLLVDARHPPTELDAAMHHWLASYRVPEIVVATKADQVPRGRRRDAQERIAATLGLAERESVVFVSSQTGEGRPSLWARIDEAVADRRRG
ncbi:MAG: ribosome biogenesis GTP-binding protein YihA/YsxC [Nitrospirota bacterium]